MAHSAFFVVWPYAAAGLLAIGIVLRCLLAPRDPDALRAQLADARDIFGLSVWWISVLTLLGGHLAGLLFPRAILSWTASPTRLYLLEGVAGMAGAAGSIGGALLVWRHLRRPARAVLTEMAESAFLGFLLLGIVSGVLVAAVYRWGASWGVMTLAPYVMSLLQGHPAPQLAARMPFLVRLHILSAFAAVSVLPLTRLSTFAVVALRKCLVLGSLPVRAAGESINRWLGRHDLSAWFWPEED